MNNIDILKEILLSDNIIEYEEKIFEIIPELKYEKDFDQKNEWHCYDVWNHTIHAIEYCDYKFNDRLVLLLHDIGKPFSYQEEKNIRHFKGHASKSKEMSKDILLRLNYYDENILNLINDHATKINIDNINENNKEYYLNLLKIQKCDSSSYEPSHAQKLLEELNNLEENIIKDVIKWKC